MAQCPNCGRQVDAGDQVCGFCEEPLDQPQQTQPANQSDQNRQHSTPESGGQPNSGNRARSQQGQGGHPQGQRQGSHQQGQQQRGQQQYSQQQESYGQQQGEYDQESYRQPPQGGGESPIQAIQRAGPMRFLKGSTILGATTGFVFAIMMVLIGKLGGFPVLPGATETARETAGSGVVGGVGQQEVSGTEAFDATLATSHETIIAYMSTELAPFLAFGLAVVVGVLVVTRLDESRTNKLATAGAGMFAGGFLLVVVSSLIIGVLGPSIPDVLLEAQGAGAAASAIDTSLASPQFSNILLNGVFAGVGSGATAAATVFSLDSFMLDE